MVLLEAVQAVDYTNNYCLYLKMEGNRIYREPILELQKLIENKKHPRKSSVKTLHSIFLLSWDLIQLHKSWSSRLNATGGD